MKPETITIPNAPELASLLGIEADGSINIQESYMAALCNDMKRILPELIAVQECDADVSGAVTAVGLCANLFQKIIRELS